MIAELGERHLPRSGQRHRGRPPTPISQAPCASKLAAAEAAADARPGISSAMSRRCAGAAADLRPSDITARLGAPWIPAADIVAFVQETMDAEITIHHTPELASWTVECAAARRGRPRARPNGAPSAGMPASFCSDALNSSIPQIFDTVKDGDSERRVLNMRRHRGGEGEAAQDQGRLPELDLDRSGPHRPAGAGLQRPLQQPRAARFRRLAPEAAGRPGASSLYGHQKRGIWRIVASGSTYSPTPSAPARPMPSRLPSWSRSGSA